MPTIIDAFLVTVGLDPTDYEKGEEKLRVSGKKTKDQLAAQAKDTEAFAKNSRAAFNALKLEALSTLAAIAGASSIKQFAANIITTDAAVGRLAHNLGVGTDELSAWQGVMGRVGGKAEDASAAIGALVDMRARLNTGQLDGNTAGILSRFGVTQEDLQDPTRAALKLAEGAKKMDPVMATYWLKQLGFSQAFIVALEKGRDGLQGMLDDQKKLGTATDESSKKAQEFEDRLGRLKTSVTGLGRAITMDLLPPLSDLIDKLTAFLSDGRGSPTDAAKGQFWGDVFAGRWDKLGADLDGKGARVGDAPARGTVGAFAGKRDPFAPGNPGGGSAPGAPAAAGGDRFTEGVSYFKSMGWSDQAARGMMAGFYAESNGLDPRAFNRAGGGQGAYGIGQWRGARLKRLRALYGDNPTYQQQLAFAQLELNTDQRAAGAAIYGSKTAEDALDAHIRLYEAPGDGYGGDIRRGRRALQQYGGGNGSPTTVNITGPISVNTRASDARGIARDLHGALATQANTGLG